MVPIGPVDKPMLSKALLASLEQMLKVEYVLLEESGETRARGVAGGDPMQISAGKYTLRLLLQPDAL